MVKPAKRMVLKTTLGKLIQAEPRGYSELLSPFFADADKSDPLDEIASELDLDSIYMEDMLKTRKELLAVTQESLKHRGLPEVFQVWRYGDINEGGITSVTLDKSVALRGAKAGKTTVNSYEITRKDVLCDVDAIFWGQVFLEEELLVRPSDLRPLESKVLETLILHTIENVLVEISI